MHGKELLNSCYGMCVTDICRSENKFDDKLKLWQVVQDIDYEKSITKYNDSKQRFLAYQWGIWVTAYARKNLWNGILEYQHDYCYSDTDSVKIIHKEKHDKYIKEYNDNVVKKLTKALNFHHLPLELMKPKTIDGKEKLLGIWDYEYTCNFKTLGAKRYLIEKNGNFELTCSGLNKKTTIEYLKYEFGDNLFNAFKNNMYIPSTYQKENDDTIYIGTGKNTHTYIDEKRTGTIIDYLGNSYDYVSESSIHLEESDYSLSLASDYVELLLNIRKEEYN